MLSNQPSNLLQGRHQRQHSTPTVYDNPKTLLPALQRQHEPHRRGLSLDRPMLIQQHHGLPQQEDSMTSDEYILQQRLTQSLLREAQQQQQTARPGLEQTTEGTLNPLHHNRSQRNIQLAPRQEHGAEYLSHHYLSNTTTDGAENTTHSLENTYKINNMDMFQSFDSTTSAGYLDGFGTGFDELTGNAQPNEIMNIRDMPHGLPPREGSLRPNSREGSQQPCTPKSQTRINYLPMTPATTPFSLSTKIEKSQRSRTADSSPTRRDPNLTIKASHAMQRGNSCQDNFAAMRQQAMSPVPSPPNTAPLKPRGSVDLAAFPQPNFLSLSSLKMDIPVSDGGYNPSNYSPMSNAVSSAMSSFQSSPEMAHLSLFEDMDIGVNSSLMSSKLSMLPNSQSAVELGTNCPPMEENPQPRSQSMSDFGIDECIEDTGVTCDEIAAFIKGPDPADGKWMCLYPECQKKFGRKENIKAHVQTHLNDRQFRCKDCNKCFVRQHDLKRHANIHSGVRSYPCPCGKPFARHDALTRHRQRGMCIGAFEGTPKKVIKRGRPKKSRPETEERLEKSAKTRQRALERRCPGKYASSVSGSSVSSYSSPPQFMDDVDFSAPSPSHGLESLQQNPRGLPADFFSYTPPTSPSYSTGNRFSSQHSQHSQHSYTPKAVSMSPSPKVTAIPEEPSKVPASHVESRKSSSSHFETPPELDISSSSPAASKFFDFDCSSEANTTESLPFDANNDFFAKDFELSTELTKEEPTIESNSIFNDFFNAELEMTGFDDASLQRGKYDEALKCLNSDNPWAEDFMNS